MKALLVGDSEAARPVADRARALGHEVVRVEQRALRDELAAADGALVILFAGEADARARIREMRGPDVPAVAPLFVVTDRDDASALADLYSAGADECLVWPREAPLLDHRLRVLTQRIERERKLAEASRAEADLMTREERLRTLIHLASDAIFIKDRGGRYVFINPAGAQSLGFTPEEIIGKTDPEVFGEETSKSVIEYDELAMKSRQPIHYEAWRKIRGEDRFFATSKFAYVSPEGDLLGIAGITRDATELRRHETAEKERTEQHLAHQAALLALAQMDEGEFVAGIERILDTDAETLALTRVSFWSLPGRPADARERRDAQGGERLVGERARAPRARPAEVLRDTAGEPRLRRRRRAKGGGRDAARQDVPGDRTR